MDAHSLIPATNKCFVSTWFHQPKQSSSKVYLFFSSADEKATERFSELRPARSIAEISYARTIESFLCLGFKRLMGIGALSEKNAEKSLRINRVRESRRINLVLIVTFTKCCSFCNINGEDKDVKYHSEKNTKTTKSL